MRERPSLDNPLTNMIPSLLSILGILCLTKVVSCTDLSQELIGTLGENGKSNWVAAPASLRIALGMLYLGSTKGTAAEIASHLGLPKDSQQARDELKKAHSFLLEGLPDENSGVSWILANKILFSQDVPLKESIKNELKKIFFAQVENTDFSNSERVTADINNWVNLTTKGLIGKLIKDGDISSDVKMIILNAVYFKGSWKTEFAPFATEKECFYVKPDVCKEVDMMESKNTFRTGSSEALKSEIIQIPYANSNYSMVIILPNENVELSEVSAAIETTNVTAVIDQLEEKDLTLSLPKFSFEYGQDMSLPLIKIGMEKMFSSTADLNGFSDSKIPLRVSKFIHKVKITVNEAGTEAAGSTGSIIVTRSGLSESFQFDVDRPFIFLIYHSKGHILFSGQVFDPTLTKTK